MDKVEMDLRNGMGGEGCPLAEGGSVRGFEILENPPGLREVLRELFTDAFMKENTNFTCFEAFRYSSAVIVNWDKDPLIYSKVLLDNFVRESTRFQTFDEMVLHASEKK